jgi:hypothetical protein
MRRAARADSQHLLQQVKRVEAERTVEREKWQQRLQDAEFRAQTLKDKNARLQERLELQEAEYEAKVRRPLALACRIPRHIPLQVHSRRLLTYLLCAVQLRTL